MIVAIPSIDVHNTASLLWLVGAIAVGAYVSTVASHRTKSGVKTVPRSKDAWPILGDLPVSIKNHARLYDWMAEKTRALGGKMWKVEIPGVSPLVVVTEPELIEEIMHTKFDSFGRGEFMSSYLEVMFGRSLFNSDGQRWYNQRKAAAKFFTAKALRQFMTTTIRNTMMQTCEVIDTSIDNHQPIEFDSLMHAFAMQTFVEIGLGVDLDWIRRPDHNPLGKEIDAASNAMLTRLLKPPFVWKLERALNIGSERVLAESIATVRGWIESVTSKSIESVTKRSDSDIKSVMELFLEHSSDGVEGMGSEDLVDFILLFVLAAQDTSAVALAWFFFIIMERPDVLAAIRNEMTAVLPEMGVTDQDTYVTADHVGRLVYLEATIKEVLRLYPSVPLIPREALQDDVIGDNVFIAKGTYIAIPPYVIARQPTVWGPDAAEFKPERWIDPTTGALVSMPSNKFMAFGTGPRTCIGMKLAMMELRVVAANLIRRYDFELAEPNDGSYAMGLTMPLKHKLMVHARRVTARDP